MNITKITGYKTTIPLKESFGYFTASLTHLPYVCVVLETDEELIGVGEAALAWDVTGETQAGALACIDLARPMLAGSSIETIEDVKKIIEQVSIALYANTALKTGIESALLDILGQHLHLPIHAILGGKEKEYVILQRTFSFEEIASDKIVLAKDAYARGARTFKYKVGKNWKKELDVIYDVRSMYPDITITLDANQAWDTVELARNFLEKVEGANISWIEQPLHAPDIEGLALLRHQCSIPVMADESCHTLRDLKILQSLNAIDLVNLKLAKCGGLFELVRMIDFCEVHAIRYALGDMLHSSIGTAYNLHAATLGNFATYDLTLPDRIRDDYGEGLMFEDYRAYIPKSPGLGARPKNKMFI
ncbi:hypothetical protein HY732_02380 [Candidatus Uhrbacteria bacterium]|nr:hypothetical protein [Candidatus Uhrbacteria bacterium]